MGRLLAEELLARGDKVIATARARSISQLDDLKSKGAHTLQLDVTDSRENIQAFAGKAISVYGRVDVVVNNAGNLVPYVFFSTDLRSIRMGTLWRNRREYVCMYSFRPSCSLVSSRPEEIASQFK